ncbi:MAG: DUF2975 domain-containing protein [Candidatus Fimivivens sp.]
MKKLHNLLNQKTAQNASQFMKVICYMMIGLLAIMLILSFMGRLQYDLRYTGEHYPHAIYAEKSHDFSTRSLTVSSNDDLRIRTQSEDGKIELSSYIAIVTMYAVGIIPLMFAYLFLSKVFANVAKGEIFVQKNAHYLLYYGLIQVALAVVLPFVKLLIVQIANMLVTDHISLATGSDMINNLIPSIGFLIAAYIINHGVNLQDEADHTL